MEAVGQLAGGIAHDINNVLQTISGACEMMRTGLQDYDRERIEELCSLSLDAAQRGGSVTQRVLAFARRAILQTEEVDAIALLVNLQLLLNHTLLGTIALELDAPPSLPMMKVDRLQLETVMINLVKTPAMPPLPRVARSELKQRTRGYLRPGAPQRGYNQAPTSVSTSLITALGWTRTRLLERSSPSSRPRALGKAPVLV